MNEDTIYARWKKGEFEWHINAGIIRTSVITYCNIFDVYKRHRDTGLNYIAAVEVTAEEMSTSPETVRRAIAAVM